MTSPIYSQIGEVRHYIVRSFLPFTRKSVKYVRDLGVLFSIKGGAVLEKERR